MPTLLLSGGFVKRILLILLPIFILAGCATEGEIKIINRTDYNLYFSIKNNDYILEGSETSDPSQSIDIDTGKQFLFWGDDEKAVPMHLEGETFMLQDADASGNPNGLFYTETTLHVEPDKTLKVFCDASHAGVKLINNTLQEVEYLSYYTDDSDTLKTLNYEPILSGETFWSRLKASTVWDSIIYSFVVEFEDGTINDSSNFDIEGLELDEQYEIELDLNN